MCVLKPGGHLFYTVPIVVGRLTRHGADCRQAITEGRGSSGTTASCKRNMVLISGARFSTPASASKSDESNLPSLGSNPCNQSLRTRARAIVHCLTNH